MLSTLKIKGIIIIYFTTHGQSSHSVHLGIEPLPGAHDQVFLFDCISVSNNSLFFHHSSLTIFYQQRHICEAKQDKLGEK
jgi:hypothetical protein